MNEWSAELHLLHELVPEVEVDALLGGMRALLGEVDATCEKTFIHLRTGWDMCDRRFANGDDINGEGREDALEHLLLMTMTRLFHGGAISGQAALLLTAAMIDENNLAPYYFGMEQVEGVMANATTYLIALRLVIDGVPAEWAIAHSESQR